MSNLPKGWRLVQLKDVSEKPDYGLTASSTKIETGVRFLRITDIDEYGHLGKAEPAYVTIDEDIFNKYKLNINDLVIARTGATAGKSYLHLIDDEFVFASYLIRFPLKSDLVNPRLIEFFTKSDLYWNQIKRFSSDAKRLNVNATSLAKLQFPLPQQKTHQELIVQILDHSHNIIQAREEAIKLCEELIEATFYEMFGDFTNNVRGIRTRKLSDYLEVNPTKIKPDLETIVSFLGMTDIAENGYIQRSTTKIASEVIKGYTSFQNNDVILAKVTPCFENGKSAIMKNLENEIGFGSTEFYVLRPSENIIPEFIWGIIRNPHFKSIGASRMQGAGGLKRVPKDFIANYQFPIPTMGDQLKFKQIFDSNTKMINSLQEALELEKLQFQSLLQAAFEGKLTAHLDGEDD